MILTRKRVWRSAGEFQFFQGANRRLLKGINDIFGGYPLHKCSLGSDGGGEEDSCHVVRIIDNLHITQRANKILV